VIDVENMKVNSVPSVTCPMGHSCWHMLRSLQTLSEVKEQASKTGSPPVDAKSKIQASSNTPKKPVVEPVSVVEAAHVNAPLPEAGGQGATSEVHLTL
jgi:hypothetical protein